MTLITQNQLLQATEAAIARYAVTVTYSNGALQIKGMEGVVSLQRPPARPGRSSLSRKF
ncbi:MAG: hypothetical protein QNJ46_15455 [Leptolyngbyaceae cyanobacterium MO_188.B28]|nr:hypothetical protein [Leptolyngbyaceae cyanobacterium MO_188.B28]